MRRLLPTPGTLSDAELLASYAFPETPGSYLRANMIASVDGAASLNGRSGTLGNADDRRLLSMLRDVSDVVLAGARTVRVEDYGAVADTERRRARRTALGLPPTPPIAVVSTRLDLDPASELFHGPARTIVATTTDCPSRRRDALAEVADVIIAGTGSVDIMALRNALAERGLRRINCEGGPRLLAAIAAADALDELCLTVAPTLAGGAADRILAAGHDSPTRLRLHHVLESDGALFLSYRRP